MRNVSGKEIYLSDMLSRQLPDECKEKSINGDEEMLSFLGSIINSILVSDVELQQVIAAQEEDFECTKIKEYILALQKK